MRKRKAFLRGTYLVLTFAFPVLGLERTLMAFDIRSVYDAIICAKLTFWSRV